MYVVLDESVSSPNIRLHSFYLLQVYLYMCFSSEYTTYILFEGYTALTYVLLTFCVMRLI